MVATSMSIANGNLLHLQLRESKQHYPNDKLLDLPSQGFFKDSDNGMRELAEFVKGNKVQFETYGTINPGSE